MEYEVELLHDRKLHGLIAITKNFYEAVIRLSVNQGPIESMVCPSTEMGKALSSELGAEIFL